MNKVNYNEIRELYKNMDTSNYDPYPIDWTLVFSPIEYMVWCDIRDYPIYMWPQYPIGKYFADFANIQKKIVIECDGKEWHNKEKDAIRDSYMASEGWTVFRLTGSECNKIVERDDFEHQNEYLHNFYQSGSGLIKAIHYFYFGRTHSMEEYEQNLAYQALRNHCAVDLNLIPSKEQSDYC